MKLFLLTVALILLHDGSRAHKCRWRVFKYCELMPDSPNRPPFYAIQKCKGQWDVTQEQACRPDETCMGMWPPKCVPKFPDLDLDPKTEEEKANE